MKSVFDSSFKYTPSLSTDVRKTFAKARREQRRSAVVQSQPETKVEVVRLEQFTRASRSRA